MIQLSIKLALICLIILSCNNPKTIDKQINKHSNVFSPDSLRGKYLVSFKLNKDTLKDSDKMAQGLMGFMMYDSKIELDFLDSAKGIMTVEGGMMGLVASMFSSGNMDKFTYNLIDSTLIINLESSKKPDTLGVLKRYTSSYNYFDIETSKEINYTLKKR